MNLRQAAVRVCTGRRETLLELAIGLWGRDPLDWPAWTCEPCGQQNSGWSLECGRCNLARTGGGL